MRVPIETADQATMTTVAGPTQSKSQTLLMKPSGGMPASTDSKNMLVPSNPSESNDESQVKIGLPYPNNIKVEKRSETSLIVSWDPPTAPLPINQSIDVDNLYDLNEQLVSVQSYNLYLNNELRSVLSGVEERVAILDDVDLTVVNYTI